MLHPADRLIRVTHAKKLLARGDLPITLISINVGYNDVTTFERNFRKIVRESPTAYRRKMRRAYRAHNITISADNSTTNAETTAEH